MSDRYEDKYRLILQQEGLRDTELVLYVPPMSTINEIKQAAHTACAGKYVFACIDTAKRIITMRR